MAILLLGRVSPFNDLNAPGELSPGSDHDDDHAADLIYDHHSLCAYYGNGLIPAQQWDAVVAGTPSIQVTTAGGAAAFVKALSYVVVPRKHMKKITGIGRIHTSNGGSVKIEIATTAGVALTTIVWVAPGAGDQQFTATTAAVNRGDTATVVNVYVMAGAVNGNTATLQSFAALDTDLVVGELP